MSEEINKEEEISLLDLLAVLIRYRKLVLISTIGAFVLSVLWFFVVPKFAKNLSTGKVQVIYSGSLEAMSPELSEYLNLDLNVLAEKELKNYVNFAKVQKSYGIFADKDLSDRAYNTAVKQIIDQKKFDIQTTKGSGAFQLVSDVKESDLEKYHKFVKEYVAYCSSNLENSVNSVMNVAKQNLDDMINRSQGSSTSSDLASLISVSVAIKTFKDNHKQIIYIENEPFEADVAKGRVKKVIIITLAFFVLSVFVVFLLNTVANIKKDPEASKLIGEAWKNGK